MSPLLLLLLILSFIALNLISKTFSKSILHPIRIIVLFWTVLIIVPVFYWTQRSVFSGESYFWIVGYLIAMEIGALFCKQYPSNQYADKDIKENVIADGTNKNWLLLKTIIILGFISVVVTLVTNGVQISQLFSINGILNANAYYSAYRSAGLSVESSTLSQILSLFVYLSAICGGYSFNYADAFEKNKKLWCIISIAPAILITLLTTGKSGTIASVIFWVCAWCISRLEIYGELPTVSGKLLKRLLVLTVLLIGLLYFTMILRIGDFSSSTRQFVLNKMYTYAFGQTLNFDIWFLRGAKLIGDGFGYNTYMVIPHVLGVGERASGVYDVIAGSSGNVFTAFRGVIQDYGIIGGLVFGLIKGFVTEYVYIMVSRKSSMNGTISKVILLCEYFWGMYAFIISAWIYTSYSLMPFAFGIFLQFYHRAIKVRLTVHAK